MNIIAGGFYDGVMLYAHALNETMTPAGDRPPRTQINAQMWNRTFQGEFRPGGAWSWLRNHLRTAGL